MKRPYILFFLLIASPLVSQNNFSKEFSIVSDNDLYTSLLHDRYYSNGLFFNYYVLKASKNKNIEKKVVHYQLGQMMYTPYKATVKYPSQHDRPFAGYLFGGFAVHRFYSDETIFNTSVQLGVIGPSSMARQVQDLIHRLYNFDKAIGWDYQIHEALGINFGAEYIKLLTRTSNNQVDASLYGAINLGSIFTNASAGMYVRIGLWDLQKLTNSVAFHSNLGSVKSNLHEGFIFIKPRILYTPYDATIEGSFLNKTSPITYGVMPFVFQLDAGVRFTGNRFNYGYSVHYHTRKLKNNLVPKSNLYGTIYLGYRFQ